MEKSVYEQWDQRPNRRRDGLSAAAAILTLLIAGGLIVAILFPPLEGVPSGVPVSGNSTLNYKPHRGP
jgi:hypothetical protein